MKTIVKKRSLGRVKDTPDCKRKKAFLSWEGSTLRDLEGKKGKDNGLSVAYWFRRGMLTAPWPFISYLSESTDFETQVYQNIQNTARVNMTVMTEIIDVPIRRQGRDAAYPYHSP